jgi:hypothetical protein
VAQQDQQQQELQQELQLQEQESLQLVASQQLQEQESDQLTAHQQQPGSPQPQHQHHHHQQQQQGDQQCDGVQPELPLQPEQQQQQGLREQQPSSQEEQQQQQDAVGHAAEASAHQTSVSQQEEAGEQLQEPDALAVSTAAAAVAVAPLGAVEQLGQEPHLEQQLKGREVSTEEQSLQQQPEASEQSHDSQQQEQQQQQLQHVHVEQQQQQQQQVPEDAAQDLLSQQQQQDQWADAAASADARQVHVMFTDSAAAADTSLVQPVEQPVVEEATLLLHERQGDAVQQQQQQQQHERQELPQHNAEPPLPPQQQHQLGGADLLTAAAADNAVGEGWGGLGADGVMADSRLDMSWQQPAGEQHTGVDDQQRQQQQQHSSLPGTCESAANRQQLLTGQTHPSAAVDRAPEVSAHFEFAAVAPGNGTAESGRGDLPFSSPDAAAVPAAAANVKLGDGPAAAAADVAVSGALSHLLVGLEQPPPEPAAGAAAAAEYAAPAQEGADGVPEHLWDGAEQQQAQPAAAADLVAGAQEGVGRPLEQPPTPEAEAVPAADAVAAGDVVQARGVGDLLDDWGYNDMLQQVAATSAAAAAANGDTSSSSVGTAPEQQQQQQHIANPGSSVAAEGGLLDLLWVDATQQQQQQLEGLGTSILQESNGALTSAQPPAVDSFDELSLLDTAAVDTPGRAAAGASSAANDADRITSAAEQHESFSNGVVIGGQLQAAEPPVAPGAQQLVAGAVDLGVVEGSKISSSNAAAQVGPASSGSWDPLNASSAPPAAASVEGSVQ